MPAATADHPPSRGGRTVLLWLAFLVLLAAAISFAWYGAGSLRPSVSESGLKFWTIKAGKGPKMAHGDGIVLDYILAADDGTVADSSDRHGGPQPMTMDGVFPGFAEAMTRMQEGGQYRFSMPEKIGWGVGQAPQGWPKGSPLTFEVQVRKVIPGGAGLVHQYQAAQAQQQMQQMQQMQAQRQPQPQQAPQQ